MMLKYKTLLITMLISYNCAFADETTMTITVGPSATANIDSNGNSVSATAGAETVIIKQSNGEGITHVKIRTTTGGNTSASAIVINGDEENIQINSSNGSSIIMIQEPNE